MEERAGALIVSAKNRHGIDWQKSTTVKGNSIAEVLSAAIKEIRRSKREEAVYWALEMAACGRIAEEFLWECLVVTAVEDVGLSNPTALGIIRDAKDAYQAMPHSDERRFIFLVFAVSYLADSIKSRYVTELLLDIKRQSQCGEMALEIPDYAIDMHTARGKAMGRGMMHYLTEASFLSDRDPTVSNTYLERLIQNAKS